MIKLIASDMDGTLLRDDKSYSEEFQDVYEEMKKRNMKFMVASGNQYDLLLSKFDESIRDDLIYLCENGTKVVYQGRTLYTNFLDKNDYLVLTIGKKGYYFAKKHQLPLITDRIISNYDDITTYSFKEEIKTVLETYLTNLFSCVEIHYMHYENAISQNPKRLVILPIELEVEEEYAPQYNYDQNVSVVLEQMAIMYIETKIFGALLNAKMSEHASRLIAMKNATDNASEISAKLNLIYHRLRQQEITNELIDIVNASS